MIKTTTQTRYQRYKEYEKLHYDSLKILFIKKPKSTVLDFY